MMKLQKKTAEKLSDYSSLQDSVTAVVDHFQSIIVANSSASSDAYQRRIQSDMGYLVGQCSASATQRLIMGIGNCAASHRSVAEFRSQVGMQLGFSLVGLLDELKRATEARPGSQCCLLVDPGNPWLPLDIAPRMTDCIGWVVATLVHCEHPAYLDLGRRLKTDPSLSILGKSVASFRIEEHRKIAKECRLGDVLVWQESSPEGQNWIIHAARVVGLANGKLLFADKRGKVSNIFATNDLSRISEVYSSAHQIEIRRPDALNSRSPLFGRVLELLEKLEPIFRS